MGGGRNVCSGEVVGEKCGRKAALGGVLVRVRESARSARREVLKGGRRKLISTASHSRRVFPHMHAEY